MHFPEELLYTKDHEWIRIEGNLATDRRYRLRSDATG